MVFEPDPNIADRLPRLPSKRLDIDAWKHTFAGQPPSAPNTRGARWNPPGVPAIYFALDRNTAVAEGEYLASVQPVRSRSSREIHALRVVGLTSVVDLRDPTVLSDLGVDDYALKGTDLGPCQRVGGTSEWLGQDALIVPSARSTGANLVIFERKTSTEFVVDLLGTEPAPDSGTNGLAMWRE